MSPATMQALDRPVVRVAAEVLPARMSRPANRFTTVNLADDRVAFAVGTAAELGILTGLLNAERVTGFRRGQEAAEAEQARRPRRIRDVVLAPGSQPISGGILAPGVQPR